MKTTTKVRGSNVSSLSIMEGIIYADVPSSPEGRRIIITMTIIITIIIIPIIINRKRKMKRNNKKKSRRAAARLQKSLPTDGR